MTTPSELEAVAPGVLKLARQGKPLHEIMEVLLAGANPVPSRSDESPPLPSPIGELSEDARLALKTLPSVFGQVNLGSRRVLTEEERQTLGQEDLALRIVLKDLAERHELIKEIIRIHADAVAEAEGAANSSDRDEKGHYLHATAPKDSLRIPIPGTRKAWSLEYHGNGVEYDMPDLLRMMAEGDITRAEFRKFVRYEFDPQRASAFMNANPARALQILRKTVCPQPEVGADAGREGSREQPGGRGACQPLGQCAGSAGPPVLGHAGDDSQEKGPDLFHQVRCQRVLRALAKLDPGYGDS